MTQGERIAQWRQIFLFPGQASEVRGLGVDGHKAVCQTFTDVEAMAEFAASLDARGAKGVYFTPNPVRPDLVGSRASARKDDIESRRWLLIDCDPLREQGTNASAEERGQAWKVLEAAQGTMEARGLRGAVIADSGNGFHLCYPIDLPNDQASHDLLKGVLKGLGKWCNTRHAVVDPATHDAPRIWKCPGTTSRKGPHSEERPHRLARVLTGPAWDPDTALHNSQALKAVLTTWQWIWDQRAGRPQTNPNTYAEAAFRQEVEALGRAQPGNRNNQLNTSAFNLGQLVAAGALDQLRVETELARVAEEIGLEPGEIRATINSGMAKGLSEPRDLTKVNGRPAGRADAKREAPYRHAGNSEDPADQDANAQDLIDQNVKIRWAWKGWLPFGVISVLASKAGTGKTRFCADLARRIYHGLPWPDGSPPTFPAGSSTLWVAADNQHHELGSLPEQFGFPPAALWLNATKRDPFGGTLLDGVAALADFEERIRRLKPALVIVDTVIHATDHSPHKVEEARRFFAPIQKMSQRLDCLMLANTHLSQAGQPHGRMIVALARLVMKLEEPEGETNSNRRKLHVIKSHSEKPAPLGVTMKQDANDYDNNPPDCEPQERSFGRRGRPSSSKYDECMEWLYEWVKGVPQRVGITISEAEKLGFSKKMVYRCKNELEISEHEAQGYKWWSLTSNEED